jgi:hypothetical protein
MTPERRIAFTRTQLRMALAEMDAFAGGIDRIYVLMGFTEKFEVAHNPAHEQLKVILKHLEERGGTA